MASSNGTDKKALYIKIGVIVVCFVGGIASYFIMSAPEEPPRTPEVVKAEENAAQIQKAMEEAPKPPAPPEPEIQNFVPGRARQAPGS